MRAPMQQRVRAKFTSPFGPKRFEVHPDRGWVHVRWVQPEEPAKNGAKLVLLEGTREEITQEMRCIVEVVKSGPGRDESDPVLDPGTLAIIAPLGKGIPIPWVPDEQEFLIERYCLIAVLGEEIPTVTLPGKEIAA